MLKFIEDLLFELKDVPGLGFIKGYWATLYSQRVTMEQKIGDLDGQVGSYQKAAKTLKNTPKNIKGSKKSD